MARIGVILSGCGVFDGAEIREAVLTIHALSELEQEIVFLAPSMEQLHVINHQSGHVAEGASRHVMEEAARIARGPVLSLKGANPDDFDAIILPGGFGAAKNLCTFALAGPEAKLQKDLRGFLLAIHSQKKPIGAMCIAPAILGLLKKEGQLQGNPRLTIGNDPSTAEALQMLGCEHVSCEADEICSDETFRFVTTPAYMYDEAPLHVISKGIHKLVRQVVGWVR